MFGGFKPHFYFVEFHLMKIYTTILITSRLVRHGKCRFLLPNLDQLIRLWKEKSQTGNGVKKADDRSFSVA